MKEEINLSEMLFNRDERLLDYITNLQEENERLKMDIRYWEDKWQYTKFSDKDYKSRIDKAIKYIMTELITEWDIENDGYVSGSDLPADAITPLLNILQGEDKDV